MPAAVLTQIERHQVDAEYLDKPNEIANGPIGGGRCAGRPQVVGDRVEVVEQPLAAEIGACRRTLFLRTPVDGVVVNVVERATEFLRDHPAFGPIRIVLLAARQGLQQSGIGRQRLAQGCSRLHEWG